MPSALISKSRRDLHVHEGAMSYIDHRDHLKDCLKGYLLPRFNQYLQIESVTRNFEPFGVWITVNSLMFAGINVCVFETKPC